MLTTALSSLLMRGQTSRSAVTSPMSMAAHCMATSAGACPLTRFLSLKREHRHLKLLLSIGGWSYSGNFRAISDSSKRTRFIESSIGLLKDYGFDGLDVDWEYPESSSDAQTYVELLRGLRHALDEYAQRVNQPRFLLTIAAPCVPDKIDKLRVSEMDEVLDLWNLMAYDFSGSWDERANHQANLKGGGLSAESAVQAFKRKGAAVELL